MTKIAIFLAVSLAACATPEVKPAGSADSPSATVAAPAAPSGPGSAGPVGSTPNPTTRPHQPIAAADLVGKWQHAFEKNVDGLETFVAASEKLPIAHFRKAFELDAGGKARVLCLAPDDAHAMSEGTWRVVGDVLTIDVKCFGTRAETTKYSVEKASSGELAVRPLP